MTIVSSDEDLTLFLDDLIKVLRKYNYDISPFTLRRITKPGIILGGFSSLNGDGVLKPDYYKMAEEDIATILLQDEEGKNENT